MSKVNKAEESKQEKVMTKYDRKMQERKAKEEKEKKEKMIAKVIGIVAAVAIVAAIAISIGISVNNKQKAISSTYAKVGEHEITGVEFDFYFNTMLTNYMNTYGSFLPYLGLDTTKDFATQQYDETKTWQDAFDQMTMEQIRETKALVDDATAKGFVYETAEEDYKNFQEGFKTQAEASGVTVAEYYKTTFGTYATETRVETYVKDTLLAAAYYNKLVADNKPTEEEVTAYYEENKKNYDNVDYRQFTLEADYAEDATPEQITEAMTVIEDKANEMMEERKSGIDFAELTKKYGVVEETDPTTDATTDTNKTADDTKTDEAADDVKTDEAADTDTSLVEKATYSTTATMYSDWLYDEARKEKDITVVKDETNHRVYVVEFISRSFNETTNESISNLLAGQRAEEYKVGLLTNYQVVDVAGKLVYLTIPEAETSEEEPVEGTGETSAEGTGEEPAEGTEGTPADQSEETQTPTQEEAE